ncbi:MAG: exodeoxyribonuclease V subunit beta [Pseudomonadales bacterium]|nr:exodeoxyribonuclease V subunit beta [Pseudomonadales bacterium]
MVRKLNLADFPLQGRQLIEASAGTGKTYTITNLYLRLLLESCPSLGRPLTVTEILVLTFTRAATEELRGRIRTRITEARDHLSGEKATQDPFLTELGERLPDVRGAVIRLTAAAQLMDDASIFTIHGFCQRVLAENAFSTHTLFNLNLDADNVLMLKSVTEDCFRSTILPLQGLARELALTQWPDPARLQRDIAGYVFRARLETDEPRCSMARIAETEAAIQRFKAAWLAFGSSDDMTGWFREAGLSGNSKPMNAIKKRMHAYCESGQLWSDDLLLFNPEVLSAAMKKGFELPALPFLADLDELQPLNETIMGCRERLWFDVIASCRERLTALKTRTGELSPDDLLASVCAALTARETGPVLAENLRRQFPVAMIDEFQDTDDTQYTIFKCIYDAAPDSSLILIGDPKQAIYQFRGADVYTYINARRDTGPDAIHSLDTNYRSSADMVNGCNHLFDRPGSFLNDADIPFTPVKAADTANKRALVLDSQPQKPFAFTLIPNPESDRASLAVRQTSMVTAAADIQQLLTRDSLIDGKPLRAGQIAVLVRTRQEAAMMKAALAEHRISSVSLSRDSVFSTAMARDLVLILQAMAEPHNDPAVRTALATSLMGATLTELSDWEADIARQDIILREFQDYHQLWSRGSIATALHRLMVNRNMARHWLSRDDGQRLLTDYRHLTELLQTESSLRSGQHQLIAWLTRETEQAHDDDSVRGDPPELQQMRLESDQDLIKIVTMHAAKGLEYDIVFIPNPVFSNRRGNNQAPVMIHEVQQERFTTRLKLVPVAEDLKQNAVENLGEDIRLLYVAITRARARCYINFPISKDGAKSAAATLLSLDSWELDSLQHAFRTLPQTLFELRSTDTITAPAVPLAKPARILQPPPPEPMVADTWRVHSYTGLAGLLESSGAGHEGHEIPGFQDDDIQGAATPFTSSALSQLTFPKGPRIGVALHALLEKISFNPTETDCQQAVEHCIARMGFRKDTDELARVLDHWLHNILTTPLGLPSDFRLCDVTDQARLNELEFHFPLNTGQAFLDEIRRHGYLNDAAEYRLTDVCGMMTGYIDLVLVHDGSYYLVDFKSNYLGDAWSDYTPARLKDAISHHKYDLQYLIYLVALHRYLRFAKPDYHYETDIGGAAYLFLRGMHHQQPGNGVWFDKPPLALIERLSDLAGGEHV